MSANNAEVIAQSYSWLRAMSGGKLSLDQVKAGDEIIKCHGLETFNKLIGYTLPKGVTGQWDISAKGFEMIRFFEGLRTKAYKCPAGIWTIGFGTIKYPNGVRVREGDTCTAAQAEEWLKSDSKWVDACLDRYVKAKITQNQFDALASFVYNVGETAFSTSVLLQLVNSSNKAGAASQFDRWIFAKGKESEGLKARRKKEKALFLS